MENLPFNTEHPKPPGAAPLLLLPRAFGMEFEGAAPTTPIKSGSSGTPQTPVGPAHPSGTGVGAENSQLQAESGTEGGNEEDPSVILPSPGEKRPAPLEKNAPEDSLSSERLFQIKQANGKHTTMHPWSLHLE